MKILATLLLLLFLTLPASAQPMDPFNFPWMSRNLLPGVMVVHSDMEGVNTAELRVCFLGSAYEREGISVEELFWRAVPLLHWAGKTKLVLALLDLNASRWVFFYVVEAGG